MPRDQRRRHEARVIEHEHLLGCIHHFARIVGHQRGALEPVEQQRGADIAEMEWRILPHQHHVDILRQIDPPPSPRREMLALDPLDRHRRGMRGDPARAGCRRFRRPGWRHRNARFHAPAPARIIISAKELSPAMLMLSSGSIWTRDDFENHAGSLPRAATHWRCGEGSCPVQQDHVDADVFPGGGITMPDGLDRRGHARQSMFVDRMIEIGGPSPPLHFGKSDYAATLWRRCRSRLPVFDPPVENLPAFRAKPDRSAGFAFAAAALGTLPLHPERSSMARAYKVLRSTR